MPVLQTPDYPALCRAAAGLIADRVRRKPQSVLGLATGSSPLGIYDLLADAVARGELSFSRASAVNLDEYVGLSAEDAQSYAFYMEKNLFSRADFARGSTHIPNGLAPDLAAECRRYDALIESLGGVDLQLLGLGRNGHIGFNEPSDRFERDTHIVELSADTLAANSRFFAEGEAQPTRAITMGVGAIFAARSVLLVASGAEKAEALAAALKGPITPALPASILQLHPNLVVVADRAALSAIYR